MKKLFYSLLIGSVIAALVCIPALADDPLHISPRLMAGQNIDIGNVLVFGFDTHMTFEFQPKAGWCITESNIHVATALEDIPQTKKGNPIPGQFDFKATHDCVNHLVIDIPTQVEWYGNMVYMAIHLVVVGPEGQVETTWAVNCSNVEAQQFPGANWAAYSIYPRNMWN